MAQEVVLNFRINNVEQAEQLGNNLEKASRGVADLIGGLALLGANEKTIEEMQKSFAEIVGITQAVKGGIEAVSASIKLMGGKITLVIGAIGALIGVLYYLTSSTEDAAEAQRKLSEEQEKSIKLQKEIVDKNNELRNSRKGGLNDLERELELLKAAGASEEEILKQETKIFKERQTNRKIEAITYEQQLKDNEISIVQFNELVSKLVQENEDDFNNITAKGIELRTKRNAADKAAWQEFQNFRIQIARQIRDFEISLIQDSDEAEVAQINEKYNRLIEDTKRNEKILQKEKDQIIKLAEENRAQDLADIEKRKQDEILKIQKEAEQKAREQKDKDLQELEDANEQAFQMTRTAQDREITAVQDKYFRLIELAKQYGQDTSTLEEEQARQIAEINKKYADAQAAKDLANLNKKISNVEFFVSAASSLTQSLFEITNNIGKQDEKSQLERAKRQFNIQKAVSATEAGINTAKAITQAIAQFGPPPSPLGIAGIATAGLIGAAQIAAILSAKFEGGASSVGGGASGVSGGAASVQPQPTFNPQLFATGAQSEQTISANQQPEIRAYVVEQEITATQSRVRQIQERASL